MAASMSIRSEGLFQSILGVVGLLFAWPMWATEHRAVAIASGAAGLFLLATRLALRVDPRRGEARVAWCTAGLLLRTRRRVALAHVGRVTLRGSLVMLEASRPHPGLGLWIGRAAAARRFAERAAASLGVPFRDVPAPGQARSPEPGAGGWLRRLWLPAVASAIGLAQLSAAGYLAWDAIAFRGRAESAVGVVVRVEVERHRRHTTQSPVIQFRTARGGVARFVPARLEGGSPLAAGDTVEVLYDPDDPRDARVPGLIGTGPAVVAGFGLLSIAVGALLLRGALRGR